MKRKFFVLTSSVYFCFLCHAQKTIDGLINAEKSFAAYSVVHGTKYAFLNFLDSSGIIFEKGNAVNGLTTWAKRPYDSISGHSLYWRPQYAEIASSNDFGFTTGPWAYGKMMSGIFGRYSTVWHIDEHGDWKVLIDLGVSYSADDTIGIDDWNGDTTMQWRLENNNHSLAVSENDLSKSEKKFIHLSRKSMSKGYKKYLSSKSILSRNNNLPFIDRQQQLNLIDTMPAIKYTIKGSGMASSGDLGYVYGTTIINGEQEGYLRIWRKEQTGWKIALEVLRY